MRGRAFVPVWLDGVGPYPFLVDTAAPYVALDAPSPPRSDCPAWVSRSRSAGLPRSGCVQALEVAGRPAIGCGAYAAGLAPMESVYGLRVAGILGLPGLPERFLLDCEGGRIARYPLEMGPEWIAVPMTTGPGGVMRVPVTLNGAHAVEAELDTAFSGTLALPRDLLEQWGLFTEHTPRLRVADGDGVRGATQIRLPECTVGPLEVVTPLCEVLEEHAAPRLGMRFYTRFALALDRAAGTLHLRPLVPVPWHDPGAQQPSVTAEQVEDLWSLFVAEDSPAQRAGLSPAPAGIRHRMDMAGQSFDYAHRALTGQPATVLDIAVLRGGEALAVTVAIGESL